MGSFWDKYSTFSVECQYFVGTHGGGTGVGVTRIPKFTIVILFFP
jgi:hypothetical protein